MLFKHTIILSSLVICGYAKIVAQTKYITPAIKYSPVVINTQMKDTFSFVSQWAYPWYVENDGTGHFSSDFGEKITAKDTAQLFFTAKCSTNVQGGYEIRYGFAKTQNTGFDLVFVDGYPAYGSEFYFYVRGDSFYFMPWTVYPISSFGEEISYRINRQTLTLNKKKYLTGDIIIGYVDAEFTQIVKINGELKDKSKLYLKGYFRTPLQIKPRLPKDD